MTVKVSLEICKYRDRKTHKVNVMLEVLNSDIHEAVKTYFIENFQWCGLFSYTYNRKRNELRINAKRDFFARNQEGKLFIVKSEEAHIL